MNSELHKTWKDSFWTLLASMTVIILNVILLGIMSRGMLQADFGDFLLIRRFTSFVFPLTTLSVGTGLTWALATCITDKSRSEAILRGTWILMFLVSLFLIVISLLIPSGFATRFILPVEGSDLWIITVIWLAGYTGYVLLYSTYRGMILMNKANLLNLAANGFMPLIIILILIFTKKLSTRNFLLVWGLSCCSTFLIFKFRHGNIFKDIAFSLTLAWRTVMTYSISRIPAGFLMASLGYLIPFFMLKSSQPAVFFLSAFTAIMSIAYLTDPLGQVFLPKAALWNNEEDRSKLSHILNTIMSLLLHTGIILTFQLVILGELIAFVWFGKGYEDAGRAIKYLSVSTVPLLLLTPLRSTLDGVERKPLITYFLAITSGAALILCLTFYFSGKMNLSNACGTVDFYFILLALFLILSLSRRVKMKINLAHFVESILLSLILGFFSHILLSFFNWRDSIITSFSLLAIAFMVCLILISIWAKIRKPCWMKIF